MRKLLVRLICCFVPSSEARHHIRHKYTEHKGCVKNTNPKIYRNNKIVVVCADGTRKCVKSFPGANITFDGDNNYIELHEPLDKLSLFAKLKSNTDIIIHSSKNDVKLCIDECLDSVRKNRLIVGPNFWSTGLVFVEVKDGVDVIIGKDCLFSWGIVLRTTDHHTIVQKGTHKIINDNKNIIIGDHVWIGSDVKVLKGAVLSDNSVVGTQSIVTGRFDEQNVVIAGIPARIIKRDIDWDVRDVYTYKREMQCAE